MKPTGTSLLSLALLSATVSQAQPATVAPWMTGERLVKLLDRSSSEESRWEDGVFIKKPRAAPPDRTDEEIGRGYINAVHDLTEGHAWCWSRYRPAPDTLQEQAIWGLRELPPTRRKENAAFLIVEIWAARHPCTVPGRRPR